MTNRQLAEWLARGNGEVMDSTYGKVRTYHLYDLGDEDIEVDPADKVRPFGNGTWWDPMLFIYEGDCE